MWCSSRSAGGKVIYGSLRGDLGTVFRRLAQQKESEIEEGHLKRDHVYMMISIPPKYSLAQVVGADHTWFPGRSRRLAG